MNCFEPISNSNSRILILGTMPGAESLKKNEYYANIKNHFWDILFRCLEPNNHDRECIQLTASYESKVNLLLRHKIALWDVLEYCDRNGSLDQNIRNEKKNNFDQFFNTHKNIKRILFNGKKPYMYFKESFEHILSGIDYRILNSTSSSNPNNTFMILDEWNNALRLPLIKYR